MILLAQVLFAVLVIATLGAFLLAQRIKQQPKAVDAQTLTRVFSPNGDGRNEVARFSIRLRRGDDVDVTVLDRETDKEVRHLVVNRHIPAKQTFGFTWDGRTDTGRLAPDAYYKLLITLRGQGRSSIANKRFILDTAPPVPAVRALGPGSGPAIVPARGARTGVTLRVADPGTDAPQWTIWRTDTPKPAAVVRIPSARGQREVYWDGRVDGRPAPAGTYLAQVRTRDVAGNVGNSPARVPPKGRVQGRPGVTVRYLAAQVPMQATRSGKTISVFVDARGKRYDWRLRRIGGTRTVAAGTSLEPQLKLQAPGGATGVYLLTLSAAGHVYRTPIAVQSGKADRKVLVVLPAMTWQGHNPVDDDGDGRARHAATTGRRGPRGRSRAAGCRDGFAAAGGRRCWPSCDRHGLALRRHDRRSRCSRPRAASSRATRACVLAGDARWLPAVLRPAARGSSRRAARAVARHRQPAAVGVASTRPWSRPRPPQPPARHVRLAPAPARAPARLELLDLRRTGSSLFRDHRRQLARLRRVRGDRVDPARRAVLAAAGRAAGQPVIVAYRLGKGVVMRLGLPQWAQRLGSDHELAAVMRRTWTLLSQ